MTRASGTGEPVDTMAGRMLEPTGERLVPDRQRGELVYAEHLARYRFAAQLAGGRRVLDAACGEGYGTAILAAAGAEKAVGVDVDAPTVHHARERYGLEFVCADVAELPFEDGSFDLIASFETIEHVADAERAVHELRRVLAPDGTLLISTPNRLTYLQDNEFHVREYSPAEFEALLRQDFDAVHFVHQQNWLTSAILDAAELAQDDGERSLALDVAKTAGARPGEELYTIALCGASSSPGSVAVMTEVYEAHELAALLRDWQARATEAELNVERAHATIRARDETIASVQASTSWRITRPLRTMGSRLRRGG